MAQQFSWRTFHLQGKFSVPLPIEKFRSASGNWFCLFIACCAFTNHNMRQKKSPSKICVQMCTFLPRKELYGARCNQLPLIEKLPQWLSGPSPFLSVTAGPLDGYCTRFKRCSDAQCFIQLLAKMT